MVTVRLNPGTYYLMDLANQPKGRPVLKTLTVGTDATAFEQDSDLVSQTFVRVTSADRFIAPHLWPHQGTYTFSNVADTIHFMVMIPVKGGTNDAQVQAAFNAPPSQQNGPSPVARPGPNAGNDVVFPRPLHPGLLQPAAEGLPSSPASSVTTRPGCRTR